jgi:hypothetical protein
MARTVEEAFLVFLKWLAPRPGSRMAVSILREQVFDRLNEKLDIAKMLEVGSMAQNSDIQTFSGGDYLLQLRGRRPLTPDSILRSVERSLSALYPTAHVRQTRPTVVVEFPDERRIGIIPAFAPGTIDGGTRVSLAAPGGGWTSADPAGYHDWFQRCNSVDGVRGAAQGLSRLARAWKHYGGVPISSFYLELQAAQFMASRSTVIYSYDVRDFFRALHEQELAAIEDPSTPRNLVPACATSSDLKRSLQETAVAASRAERALARQRQGDTADSFDQWSQVFSGQFPAYY